MQIAYIPFGASAPLRTYFRVPHRERMAPRGYILYRSLSNGLRMYERAVEGRKKIQDGKAVSKYYLDAMDEERAAIS